MRGLRRWLLSFFLGPFFYRRFDARLYFRIINSKPFLHFYIISLFCHMYFFFSFSPWADAFTLPLSTLSQSSPRQSPPPQASIARAATHTSCDPTSLPASSRDSRRNFLILLSVNTLVISFYLFIVCQWFNDGAGPLVVLFHALWGIFFISFALLWCRLSGPCSLVSNIYTM